MVGSAMLQFESYMTLRGLSAVTIQSRHNVLSRLHDFLGRPVVTATPDDLRAWQTQFIRLAPASIDVYTRHVQAFFRWAVGVGVVSIDPSVGLARPRVPAGRPHPTAEDDLRLIFSCTSGTLRIVFALATFAGLRRGEICRLQRPDVDLTARVVHVLGKGNKERDVPLIGPLVNELAGFMRPHGYLVVREDGVPYVRNPDLLSGRSARYLRSLGVHSTLHSMRHAFATDVYRTTHDLLFVAELLGHASVNTTQIYAKPDFDRAQERMASIADLAASLLSRSRLRAV